jgi:hypothetical protein
MSDNIIINNTIDSNYTEFDGDNAHQLAMQYYFSYKYSNCFNSCLSILYNIETKNIHLYALSITDKVIVQYISVKLFQGEFKKYLLDNNIKLIIFHLTITTGNLITHANNIIYYKDEDAFELFEPHGQVDDESQYDTLETWFKENLRPDSKLIKPSNYCPQRVFQSLEDGTYLGDPGGFCAAWSMLYIDLKLSNINVLRDELIRHANQHITNYGVKKFIGDYSAFVNIIKKAFLVCQPKLKCSSIFFTISMQFHDLLNDNILYNDLGLDEHHYYNSYNIILILTKIINCISKNQLLYMYTLFNYDTSEINGNNYSVRKALVEIVNRYENNDQKLYTIYKQLVNNYYVCEYNIFSVNLVRNWNSLNLYYCPDNLKIIKELYELFTGINYNIRTISDREQLCLKVYKIINKFIVDDINLSTEIDNKSKIFSILKSVILLSGSEGYKRMKKYNGYHDTLDHLFKYLNEKIKLDDYVTINLFFKIFCETILASALHNNLKYFKYNIENIDKYTLAIKQCSTIISADQLESIQKLMVTKSLYDSILFILPTKVILFLQGQVIENLIEDVR